MRVSRRKFMASSAAASAIAAAACAPGQPAAEAQTARPAAPPEGAAPAAIAALKPYPGTAVAITDDERRARIEKARKLMAENGMGALVLEPSTSMSYFVDVRWGQSERPFLLVIPAKGELAYVTPGFEEM